MQYRLWLVVALALTLCTSCASPPPEPVKAGRPTIAAGHATESSTTSTTSAAGSEEQPLERDKHLIQMADDLNNTAFSFEMTCPETLENSSVRIKNDPALYARVAALLTQSSYEPDAVLPELTPTGTVKELYLRAQQGRLFSELRMYGYADNHPVYPNQMLLELKNDSGQTKRYLYDMSVFDQIYEEVRQRLHGATVEFSGGTVYLKSKYDLAKLTRDHGMQAKEFLQMGRTLLFRYQRQSGSGTTPSTVEVFDPESGKSLYAYQVEEAVDRMEMYGGLAGYDYRIFTPTRILYRSTANPKLEQQWKLPAQANLFVASADLMGAYDVRYGKLAYAAQDGLYIANEDGSGARMLVPHSALAAVMPGQTDAGGSIAVWYYSHPRVLDGGTKVLSAVVSPQTGEQRLAFAVTDCETGETTYFTDLQAAGARDVRYPSDTVVAVHMNNAVALLDTNELEVGMIPLTGLSDNRFFTRDYQNFLVSEHITTNQDHLGETGVYLCEAASLFDRSNKLFSAKGDTFYPVEITNEFLIGYCEDSRGIQYTAARFRTAPAQPLPQANSASSQSSSLSSDSSASDTDEEGTLPPDITPEF